MLDPFLQRFSYAGDSAFNIWAAERAIEAADLPQAEKQRLRAQAKEAARCMNVDLSRARPILRDRPSP